MLQGAMKFQEQLNYEISNVLITILTIWSVIVVLIEPKSLQLGIDGA